MKTLYKRIERLSARIRLDAGREFTLEELCRLYWRMNKRGFKAFANGSPFQFFADCFEREDAERATRDAIMRRKATRPRQQRRRAAAV
jgi:hypothetical protein